MLTPLLVRDDRINQSREFDWYNYTPTKHQHYRKPTLASSQHGRRISSKLQLTRQQKQYRHNFLQLSSFSSSLCKSRFDVTSTTCAAETPTSYAARTTRFEVCPSPNTVDDGQFPTVLILLPIPLFPLSSAVQCDIHTCSICARRSLGFKPHLFSPAQRP